MSQIYLPGDETFAAYMREIAGATVEIELSTGRGVTGRLAGVHDTWLLVIDGEKKYTIAQMTHVAAIRVLEWKNPSKKETAVT